MKKEWKSIGRKKLRKKNDYYVYVISETKTMKPIYIGKGKNNRLNWHIFAIKSGYHYNKNNNSSISYKTLLMYKNIKNTTYNY